MSREAELRKLLSTEKVVDVHLIGYSEQAASTRHFHPMLWWVYLAFESKYLRLEAVNQWHLQIDIVDAIGQDFEDDPDEFSIASVGAMLIAGLADRNVAVLEFRGLLDDASEIEAGRIKCGGFRFENDDELFFDPSGTRGLRAGSEAQVEKWTSLLHYDFSKYKRYSLRVDRAR
jgi:hypothetical protein